MVVQWLRLHYHYNGTSSIPGGGSFPCHEVWPNTKRKEKEKNENYKLKKKKCENTLFLISEFGGTPYNFVPEVASSLAPLSSWLGRET